VLNVANGEPSRKDRDASVLDMMEQTKCCEYQHRARAMLQHRVRGVYSTTEFRFHWHKTEKITMGDVLVTEKINRDYP
jgi:hypothetical protein